MRKITESLYLVGKHLDINGNSCVKVRFKDGRAFSIQINGASLDKTWRALQWAKVTPKFIAGLDIKTVSDIGIEIQEYILNYGSKAKKDQLLKEMGITQPKNTKYKYLKVIQQNYGAHGWEDLEQFETDSTGLIIDVKERKQINDDLKEYRFACPYYPVRVIKRKELR